MQIKDLPSSGSLAATDVLAKDASGGTTEKINGSDLASSIKTLGSLLGTSDVVNNLSNGETRPVSSGAVYTAVHGLITIEEQSTTLTTSKYGSFYYGDISTDTRNIIAVTVIGSSNNMFATVQSIDSRQNGYIRVFGDLSGGTVYVRILRKSS